MAPVLRAVFATCIALATSLVTAQDTPIPLVCQEGVQIIAVVGANVPNGTDSYGLTQTFVQDVMHGIPQSANFSMNYNRFHLMNESHTHFIPEVGEGVPELHTVLQNYTTACPKTPIVLHGYSEGAVVIMNLLCGGDLPFPITSPLSSSFAPHSMSCLWSFHGNVICLLRIQSLPLSYMETRHAPQTSLMI